MIAEKKFALNAPNYCSSLRWTTIRGRNAVNETNRSAAPLISFTHYCGDSIEVG